uniref:sphingomyelin phosphodiesterase n=1 Tax=Meloidogyne javanica TaxID=6303 RepID=A0A915N137_MELJA
MLRVATLNCWLLPHPWPIGSKHKTFRIQMLISALAVSKFDIVALQEIWSEKVFIEMVHNLKEKFPYSHYFHSGFTGSGTCILSRYPIISTLLHRYSLNGFPHHIHRGDWFGGKIVGMAEILFDSYKICFYTTHLHAEYNKENDLYLPHRISQCFEMSQFIRHTCGGADFVILVGDFNLEPTNLGFQLIKNLVPLNDAWECRPNAVDPLYENGTTCERPDNCYTSKCLLKSFPDGKRLDYLMYRSEKTEIKLLNCEYCFDKIPESDLNYSDHLGVSAKFEIKKENQIDTGSQQLRQLSIEKQILTKSLKIIEEAEIRVLWDRPTTKLDLNVPLAFAFKMKRFLPAISGYAPIQRFEKPTPRIYYAPEWRLDKSGRRDGNLDKYSPMNNYGVTPEKWEYLNKVVWPPNYVVPETGKPKAREVFHVKESVHLHPKKNRL